MVLILFVRVQVKCSIVKDSFKRITGKTIHGFSCGWVTERLSIVFILYWWQRPNPFPVFIGLCQELAKFGVIQCQKIDVYLNALYMVVNYDFTLFLINFMAYHKFYNQTLTVSIIPSASGFMW